MKDEEMFNEWKSEQYKDQSTEEKMEFVEHLHTFPRYFKKAFLAGLKAGREVEKEYVKNNAFTSMKEQGLFPFGKWHKVADGDLPKNRRNVYVVYLNGYNEIEKTIASFRHKFWVFDGHKTECEIIAWCELPKYMEK